MRHFLVALTFVFVVPLGAQTERDELLNSPQYVDDGVKPTFVIVAQAQLEESVTATSSRNYAMFGFNTPEVTLHLPRVDNSVYAKVQFSEAKLHDGENEVAYERENGLYNHDRFSIDVRFPAPDGKEIISYTRADGSAIVKYPSEVKTVRVKKGDDPATLAKLGLVIDGPYVEVWERGRIADDTFDAPFAAVRAFDGEGRMLEREFSYSQSGWKDGENFRTIAFHGEVARVDADIIEKWIGLELEYSLPPSPLIRESAAGLTPDLPETVAATLGGTVTKKAIRVLPPEVLGDAADMTREEIMTRLGEDWGYREVSPDYMMGAVSQGQIEAVRLFLAAGISPDASAREMPMLVIASMFGKDDIAMLLLGAGANPNARDSNEATAIISAGQRCASTPLVRALVEAGADVNARAKGGGHALMMANMMKCEETIAVLKKAGAKE